MIYPQPLKKGDKVAVICLSSGVIGEPYCAHEKELGIKKLRKFGLEPVFTEHALMGRDYILCHPEARTADLKTAFLDGSVNSVSNPFSPNTPSWAGTISFVTPRLAPQT